MSRFFIKNTLSCVLALFAFTITLTARITIKPNYKQAAKSIQEIDFLNGQLPRLVICGEEATATVDIVKIANDVTVQDMQLSIYLDQGLHHSGSFTATGCNGTNAGVIYRNDLSTEHVMVFDFPDMRFDQCGKINLKFNLSIDCEILDILNTNPNATFNWKYEMKYAGGSDSKEEIPVSQIAKPQLTISNPGGRLSAPGSVIERKFTICQTGVDSYLDDALVLKDIGAAQLNVRAVKINGGAERTSYVSGAPGNQTITIPVSEFTNATLSGGGNGNNNNKFDGPISGNAQSRAECLEITEVLEVMGCDTLNSKVTAFWGCNNKLCDQSEEINTSVSIDLSLGPRIKVDHNIPTPMCMGRDYIHEIKLTNIGNGAAEDVIVDVYVWSGIPNTVSGCSGGSIDENSFEFSLNGGPFQKIIPFQNQSVECPDFGDCYTKAINVRSLVKFEKINAGDVITLRYTKQTCCPKKLGDFYVNGDALRINFSDNCRNFTELPPILLNNQIVFTTGNILYESITDIADGQTFDLLYLYKELSFSTVTPNSFVELELQLPRGIRFTGNPNDFFWQDADGRYWDVESVNYNPATNIIKAVLSLKVLDGKIFGRTLSEIHFRNLKFDCNLLGPNPAKILVPKLKINFYPDRPDCPCNFLLGTKDIELVTHCEPILNGCQGLKTFSYSIKRATLGLKDLDDDETPDNKQIADPTDPIKLLRVSPGDELVAKISAVVLDTAKPKTVFPYLYLESNFESAQETEILSTQLTIYDASQQKYIRCQNLPKSLINKDWKFDASRAILLSAGCADPNLAGFDGYAEGDSVFLDVRYKINKNLPAKIIENNVINQFYLSKVENPVNALDKFQCDIFRGNFIYFGYIMNVVGFPVVFDGCEKDFIRLRYEYYNTLSNLTYGTNLFPFEYRSQNLLKELEIEIPNGYAYAFDKTEVELLYGSGAGIYTSEVTTINPVSINGNKIKFDLSPLYQSINPSGPWIDPDDAYTINIKVYVDPDCSATEENFYGASMRAKNLLNLEANGNNSFGEDDEFRILNRVSDLNSQFKIINIQPKLVPQSKNRTVNGVISNFSWPLTINNISPNTEADNVWIALRNPSGLIQLAEVKLGNTVIPAGPGGIYKLGRITSLGGQLNVEIGVNSFRNCNLDSVIVLLGWDCTKYPNNVSNAICQPIEYPLYISPFNTDLSAAAVLPRATNPVTIYNLCDAIEFVVQVDNVGQALASNIFFDVLLPKGFELVQNSTYVQYKINTSIPPAPNVNLPNWVKINDPLFVRNDILGQRFRWDITKDWNLATGNNKLGGNNGGFPFQILDADSSKFYIRFLGRTRCGFENGVRIPYQTSAQSPCQIGSPDRIESITGFTPPINLIDPSTLYGAKIKIKTDTFSFVGCETAHEAELIITNFGPASTGVNDSITIDIPDFYEYKSGSTIAVRNFGGGEPTIINMGNVKRLEWAIGTQTRAGDSIVIRFSLSPKSNSLDCSRKDVFNNRVITTRDLVCSENSQVCRTQITLAEADHPVVFSRPSLALTYQNTTCPDAMGMSNSLIKIKIQNSGIEPGQYIRIRIIEDINKNGVLDAIDEAQTAILEKIYNGPYAEGTYSFSSNYVTTIQRLQHAFYVVDGSCVCFQKVVSLKTPFCGPCVKVGDYVWEDSNSNGIQDNNESGINGVTVHLMDASGFPVETQITSDNPSIPGAKGYYKFCICDGRYYLKFDVPKGFAHTLVNAGNDRTKDSDVNDNLGGNTIEFFTIAQGNMYCDYDAGLIHKSTIQGIVWLDQNYDGLYTSQEKGVKEIKVSLFDAERNLVSEVTTNAEGQYEFKELEVGKYFIKINVSPIYEFSYSGIQNNPIQNSDINNANGYATSDWVSILNNGIKYHVDAGLILGADEVDKIKLEGSVANNKMNLIWSKQNVEKVEEFIVQRSAHNEYAFEDLSAIKPSVLYGSVFNYQDENLIPGKKYDYRIKENNVDLNTYYSNLISNEISNENIHCTVSPVPVNEELYISYYLNQATSMYVSIMDADGKECLTLLNGTAKTIGYHKDRYEVKKLNSGVYWLKIKTKDNNQIIKFVKALD